MTMTPILVVTPITLPSSAASGTRHSSTNDTQITTVGDGHCVRYVRSVRRRSSDRCPLANHRRTSTGLARRRPRGRPSVATAHLARHFRFARPVSTISFSAIGLRVEGSIQIQTRMETRNIRVWSCREECCRSFPSSANVPVISTICGISCMHSTPFLPS